MKLKCINVGNNKSITAQNEYEVINELATRYVILNDRGVEKNYAKNLFEVVPEVPEVPPVEVIDELDITTDIVSEIIAGDVNGRSKVTATLTIKLNNNLTYEKEQEIGAFQTTAISCGIYQFYGVDSLAQFATRAKAEFNQFLQRNAEVVELNPEINLDATFKEITETLVQDLIAASPNSAMVTLSTNITGNNTLNANLVEALDAVSINIIERRNPNSGNQIKLWVLDTNEE